MIDWTAFTWQAFATLATGFAAVTAGYVIAAKQAEILKRQTFLQELSFRKEVFDRRLHVYRAVREYIQEILNDNRTEPLTKAICDRFYDAVDISRFLFSRRLEVQLGFLGERAFKLVELRGKIAEESLTLTESEARELRLKAEKARLDLEKDFSELPRAFEREMRITAMKHAPKRRHFDPEFGMTYEEALDTLKARIDTY